jgi:DhnA family fructose-bisphosphate aldolase class Ia
MSTILEKAVDKIVKVNQNKKLSDVDKYAKTFKIVQDIYKVGWQACGATILSEMKKDMEKEK